MVLIESPQVAVLVPELQHCGSPIALQAAHPGFISRIPNCQPGVPERSQLRPESKVADLPVQCLSAPCYVASSCPVMLSGGVAVTVTCIYGLSVSCVAFDCVIVQSTIGWDTTV